ncbi:MAG TPA: hypothetical protein VGY54_12035 [Polyangiaceae bacterium]|jgi:hypothetical protein|nr:hypothetical protein [Polyangiaceae bacterium]
MRSVAARVTTICAVPIDVMRAGNRFPERMNRFSTAMATYAAQPTSITDGAATIASVAMRFIDVLAVFSHAAAVPRLAKDEKLKRDTGIIAGIRKHRALWTIRILRKSYTPDELIAVFDGHLRALARVSELTTQRAIAIAEERALEARIARLARAVKSRLAAYFGANAPETEAFGFRPDKKPTMSVETKRRANEKRQATRKERGIMGRKQRKKAKTG